MKTSICTIAGVIGATLSALLGGWDHALATLLYFMAADYITGVIVAGVFKASAKSPSGALESRAGWKGLCRKCVTILFVLIAHRLDLALGVSYVRDGVIYGFMLNELISLVENAGLMGIPLPPVLTRAIDVLKNRTNEKEDNHDTQ